MNFLGCVFKHLGKNYNCPDKPDKTETDTQQETPDKQTC